MIDFNHHRRTLKELCIALILIYMQVFCCCCEVVAQEQDRLYGTAAVE